MVIESFVTQEKLRNKNFPETKKTAKDLLNTVQRFFIQKCPVSLRKLLIANYLIAESDSFLNPRS